MIIGVPKEIKNHEYRVGLTPRSVKEFINHGHKVLVQANAGVGIGASDDEYASSGAEIISTAKEVFDILYKLKSSNRLIIYATHNRFFANMADCKLEMINGNIKTINARIK